MIIKEFNIDLNYISNTGESRPFLVTGDMGAIFSLIVKKQTGSTITYYDFSTKTFVSTQKRLKNRKLITGTYSGSILFPAGGLSSGNNPNTYTLMIFAESAYGSNHVPYAETRFADGSLDINSSTGSNSDLMQKVLYQFPETVVTLSAISPNSLSGFSGVNISSQTITTQRGNTTGSIPFSITCTLGSTKSGRAKKRATIGDITSFAARTLGEPVAIPGVTANQGGESGISLTINNLPRSNSNTFTVAEIGATAVGMTIKGTAFDGIYDKDHPVIVTGVTDSTITINKNVTIANVVANTSATANDIRYRRWKCSQIQGLVPGMLAFSGGVIAGTRISRYLDTTDQVVEITDPDGGITEQTNTIVNFDIPALDTVGHKPVIQYGSLSTQQGIITFDTPQIVASNRNVGTKFYAYGSNSIKSLHKSTISINNLAVEIEEVTTTINDASADGATALNDFDVASTSGIMDDFSTVHGVNISPTGITPTVTNISSSNLTLTPGGHYVQNGQTLTFKGAGRVINITGDINLENIDDTDFSLRFDLEKFITAT